MSEVDQRQMEARDGIKTALHVKKKKFKASISSCLVNSSSLPEGDCRLSPALSPASVQNSLRLLSANISSVIVHEAIPSLLGGSNAAASCLRLPRSSVMVNDSSANSTPSMRMTTRYLPGCQ